MPKKSKQKPRAKIEKELDAAWSLFVRKRDRVCQFCGSSSTLAAHHAFGRVHRATRFDVCNGVSLCWPCHKFRAHGDPCGFREWFKDYVGVDQYERLAEAHNIPVKHTMEQLQQMLAYFKDGKQCQIR